MHTPNINNHSHSNLAATGLFAGILEVSGKSKDFESEPARLCQRGLLRNGIHRVTEFCTQVRVCTAYTACWSNEQLSMNIVYISTSVACSFLHAEIWVPEMYSLEMITKQRFQISVSQQMKSSVQRNYCYQSGGQLLRSSEKK